MDITPDFDPGKLGLSPSRATIKYGSDPLVWLLAWGARLLLVQFQSTVQILISGCDPMAWLPELESGFFAGSIPVIQTVLLA